MFVFINPWIYDFAAYDYWAKPLGLLYLASAFQEAGYQIELIDCLETDDSDKNGNRKKTPYGRKKYRQCEVPKPEQLKGTIPRKYKRYGCDPETFESRIAGISEPEVFFITSHMTYWYPGIKEALSTVKAHHPDVPTVLGGLYAQLCPEHAQKHSGADFTVATSGELHRCLSDFDLETSTVEEFSFPNFYPAFELYNELDYVPLLTSTGCPFECTYCASPLINPEFNLRSPGEVYEEINHWHSLRGIKDYAFYDDALFSSKEKLMIPLLKKIVRDGPDVRFHTPNGLHIRYIDEELAELMFEANFKTLKLGLESSDPHFHKTYDEKTSVEEFLRALTHLRDAGFDDELGVYIMAGLPGQSKDSVEGTIDFVSDYGVDSELAEYSPVPDTDIWKKAQRHSPFDIEGEPLFHNNTLVPCRTELDYEDMNDLKQRTRE